MCVSEHMYMHHLYARAQEGQKRVSDSVELEFQVAVSHYVGVAY